jgi:hypothetical protein
MELSPCVPTDEIGDAYKNEQRRKQQRVQIDQQRRAYDTDSPRGGEGETEQRGYHEGYGDSDHQVLLWNERAE